MTKILILGANGQIARHVVRRLGDEATLRQTLFVRSAARMHDAAPANAQVVEGDVLDRSALDAAMVGQDMVYANLTGDDIDDQAHSIIASMKDAGVKRLLFVTSLGIYHELPPAFEAWNDREIGVYLPPFRRAADAIEGSGLDYTILRPAWLTDGDEIDYETTTRDEIFKGTEISRKSVADYIVSLIENPTKDVGGNIGLSKPGTDGDKPAFM